MLANLKIRTGVIGVLLAFLVALMLSSFSAWYSVESTQEKLERVNGVYAREVVPLLHASNDMLSARVLIGSTFMNFQAGEGADLTGDATRSRALLATAQRHHGVFAAYPYEEEAKEGAAAVTRSFNAYHATLARMVEAIEGRSVRDYEAANRQAQVQNAAFEAAVGSLASHMDEASDALVEDARGDFLMTRIAMFAIAGLSVLLAIGCWFFMQRTVLRPLGQASVHFDRIAAGDMTGHVEVRSTNEIGTLFAALRRMQDSLTRTVARVRSGVDEINVGAREIAAGNNDLSGRTEQQAASLEQTAASMEELASTVKQNADNARQANALAAGASSVAQRGGQAVGAVVQTMEGISTSSHKIAEIVGVIDSIAFQTNILALNAAVEAARAGEQGKGFAVVAAEVRSLAQRSAQAAKEIKTLIDDSVDKVNNGSAQVESAGATMQEIVEAVRRVSDIIAEIAAASNEQAGGIDQVNQAVTAMDQVTQQNAALVEQAAAAAGALQDQAQSLAQAVQVFRIDAGSLQGVGVEQVSTVPLATIGSGGPAQPADRVSRETGKTLPRPGKAQRGDETSGAPADARPVVHPGGELAARRLRKEVVPALPARRVPTPPKEDAAPGLTAQEAGPASAAGGRGGKSSTLSLADRPAGSPESTVQKPPRAAAPAQPAARRKPQVKDDDWETF